VSCSRILLFAPLLATVTVAFARPSNGDGCDELIWAQSGICVVNVLLSETVTTTSETFIDDGVSIGPFVALGDVYVAKNVTIGGWQAHITQPLTIGDGTVFGRNANIGVDSIFGADTSIGRGATLGARATTSAGVSIGHAAELGTDTVLDDGAVIGKQVGLGDFTHMGPLSVIGRNSTVTGAASAAERSDIMGIVGNNALIGTSVLVEPDTRVRKDATIGSGAQVLNGATIGRDAYVEADATVHGRVRAYGRVCAGDTVEAGQVVARYMTNQGTSTCSAPPALEQRPRPLAIGISHACAVLPDETAVCWGRNIYGELGNGYSAQDYVDVAPGESIPVAVVGLTDVAGFALSNFGSCALKTDGTVWCWGSQDHGGQLGNNGVPYAMELTPVQVIGLTDATAIASAVFHSCAVKSDTTVVCWGFGPVGGLGIEGEISEDHTGTSNVPIQVMAADGNPLSGILDIALGPYSSCALAIDGQVFCWGRGTALGGNGTSDGNGGNLDSFTPVKVDGLENIREISMGYPFALALEPDGTVLGWGEDENRHMGNTTTGNQRTPVTAFTGAGAVAALGAYQTHSCMLLEDQQTREFNPNTGRVVCAGGAANAQVSLLGAGVEVSSPETPYVFVDQSEMGPVAALAHSGAGDFTCARTPTGDVWCWGHGGEGQLGNGSLFENSDIPVQVSGLNMGPLQGLASENASSRD
jgi:alpha-tubulin suppressor-like RCC1 family protein/UDP-3-O-[3-hydroxymyristoyl] glucosamine N-acyltransferase